MPTVDLSNPRADRVKRIRALTTASGRRRHRQLVVEGPQSVREAVRHARARVRDVYLTVAASQRHPEIVDDAADLYLHLCSPDVLEAMSPDAQGVVAVLDAEQTVAAEVFAGAPRLVVLLAQGRDPGNVGTVIRAADAAGADAVVLGEGSVDPANPKVLRSAAGSSFHLPVASGAGAEAAVELARRAGMTVLAADGAGSVELGDAPLDGPVLWLFGNEAHGLTDAERTLADHVVSIPIYGKAESLNLAMAATVCLYATADRHRR